MTPRRRKGESTVSRPTSAWAGLRRPGRSAPEGLRGDDEETPRRPHPSPTAARLDGPRPRRRSTSGWTTAEVRRRPNRTRERKKRDEEDHDEKSRRRPLARKAVKNLDVKPAKGGAVRGRLLTRAREARAPVWEGASLGDQTGEARIKLTRRDGLRAPRGDLVPRNDPKGGATKDRHSASVRRVPRQRTSSPSRMFRPNEGRSRVTTETGRKEKRHEEDHEEEPSKASHEEGGQGPRRQARQGRDGPWRRVYVPDRTTAEA